MVPLNIMPHFVLEYSRPLENQLDLSEVMEVAFAAGVNSGVMKAADIKVRALPYDHYRLDGSLETFLHVSIYMLAGRTPEQKEHVSTLLRNALAEAFPGIGSISIDIRDMDTQAYKKHLRT